MSMMDGRDTVPRYARNGVSYSPTPSLSLSLCDGAGAGRGAPPDPPPPRRRPASDRVSVTPPPGVSPERGSFRAPYQRRGATGPPSSDRSAASPTAQSVFSSVQSRRGSDPDGDASSDVNSRPSDRAEVERAEVAGGGSPVFAFSPTFYSRMTKAPGTRELAPPRPVGVRRERSCPDFGSVDGDGLEEPPNLVFAAGDEADILLAADQ